MLLVVVVIETTVKASISEHSNNSRKNAYFLTLYLQTAYSLFIYTRIGTTHVVQTQSIAETVIIRFIV